MRRLFLPLFLSIAVLFAACGGSGNKSTTAPKSMVAEPSKYDAHRGEGKFNADNVKVSANLDVAMAEAGAKVQGVKCASCHKLTEEKLVGPGWKGVTSRRAPEWIMNFITNPDPMIDKDPAVQAQLELCLVRMPNQSLAEDEARSIVEFMRKNDGIK
ncbi:MAG: c-type cytochrome [Saprospiraceae bacterium]